MTKRRAKKSRGGPAVAILGLGKAGGSLLASARASKIPVVAKAARLAALLRLRAFSSADVLFVAVPDDALKETAESLAGVKQRVPPLIVHLAGALGPSA